MSWLPLFGLERGGRRLLVLFLGALTASLCCVATAHAQTEAACSERLTAARDLYETRQYEEAVDRLSACLWRSGLSVDFVEEGYRLLALAYLRLDDVPNARLALVELLARSPDYRPDPVRDLPSYVSLARLVRQQVQGAAADTTAVDTASSASGPDDAGASATSSAGRISLALFGGLTNYYGERSPASGGLAEEAGPAIGALLDYRLTRYIDLGVSYHAGRYLSLLDDRDASYPRIDGANSSDWLHMVGLQVAVHLLPQRRVTPVAHLGLNTAFSLINNTIRASVGPRFGVGADIRLAPRVEALVRAGGFVTVPDNGTDLASGSSSISDTYSFVIVGLRYRFASAP